MPNTTLAYYKLKTPASIPKGPRRWRSDDWKRRDRANLDRVGHSTLSIALRLLVSALILILATSAQAQRQTAAVHIVRPGETLGLIAQQYGVDVYKLASTNGISNAHLIHTWQELKIPADATQIEARGTHIVRRGESLDSIARFYGIAARDLMTLNNIYGWLYPGDELALPVPGQTAAPVQADPPPPKSSRLHIVRHGETLGAIAEAYGLSLHDLKAANNIWTWIIYVGQELVIPGAPQAPTDAPNTTDAANATTMIEEPAAPSTPAPAPAPPQEARTHTVQRGETLFRIAQNYGVSLDALVRANGIADATKIHSGLVLRISDLERFVPPAPAPAATAANPAQASRPIYTGSRTQYTVQPGDFLSRIGAKFGMNWLAIRDINAISNPDNLHVGMLLQIPTKAEAEKYGPIVITNYSRFHSSNDHPGPKIGVGKEIVVVLNTQTAYAYENGQLMRRALMSSGMPDTPTVQGDFKVRTKVRSQRMSGDDYDLDNVEWVMYFKWEYAIHGAWWHNNFGEPMSHGCVNMTNADAKWFYDFAPIGTPVHVRQY